MSGKYKTEKKELPEHMKFRAKKLILLAGVTVCAAAFAACGKSSAKETAAVETEAATENSAAESSVAESSAAESNAPESYGSVKLGTYKGIDLTVTEIQVTDADVDGYIESLVAGNPDIVEVERAAKSGDTVNIDYVGKKDGTAFEGGTASGYDLELGSGRFIEGFEDGLIGARKGERRTLNLSFPEDYGNAELAGQAVTFDVTVNAVKETREASFDDAWVEKYTNGEQKTVEEYRAAIRAQLTEQAEKNEKSREISQAIQKTMENLTFTLNPEAVSYEVAQQKANTEAQLAQYGTDLSSYLQMLSMTQEDYDKQMQEAGESAVKLRLLIESIVEAEGFTLGEADYKELESYYGYSKDMLVSMVGQEAVDLEANYLKVANFIIAHANKVAETAAAESAAGTETSGAAATESAAQ